MKTKKLHIIFLDFDDIKNPLLGAGQARATVEVGKRLVQKGYEITVISSRYPGYRDRKENGILYRHIGLGSQNIRINNLIYILALPFSVVRLRGDIIIECFTAPISTLFSPVFTKIPVVALPSSFEAERFSKLYHLPFDKIETFGLRFYRYYLPFSDFFDQKMKKYNKNVISRIVPEGVSQEFFAIKKKQPKYILFLGRLDMGQKGIDLLLQAYKKIEDKIKYPLVIAGNGPDEEKIRSLIISLNLQTRVKMIGPTYSKKKMNVLSEALFIAFSSRNETFSCFALEAFASGLPMVSFNIPGLYWINERELALKATCFSVDHYARLLLQASKIFSTHSVDVKARRFAKHFTWEKVVNEFIELFDEILVHDKVNKKLIQI